jgi:hypothetical protein
MTFLRIKKEALSFDEGLARVGLWSSIEESSIAMAVSSPGHQQFWRACIEVVMEEWDCFFVLKFY